ncbi:MAG: heparinase, partial [Paracoccaceae bacterium]|nr:heparinase [Paracoccaceae bacterium]
MHRVHARRAARTAATTSFLFAPEPRTIGVIARGQQLIVGNFLFSGLLVKAPNRSIWDIAPDNETVEDEIQGCAWLDDLAALGDERARERAQSWVFEWINRYGDGRGSGWTPDLVGRRLIRWINHALLLLRGRDKETADRFYASLSRQTVYLSRRWRRAPQGLPRFEALTGMIHAGLSLEGMQDHVEPAIAALAADCQARIGPQGDIPSRNPEELLEVFTLLTWASATLNEAGRTLPPELVEAIG